jgi:predicted phage tail protein
MTKIYLKGAIAKKFGAFFSLKIKDALSALKAIDANRFGFIKELMDLNKLSKDYYLVCNGELIKNSDELIEKRKIDTIHIIPVIFGHGEYAAFALELTEIAANGAVVLSTAGQVVATLVNLIISTAISLGVGLIMDSLNKQASPPKQFIAVGGATAAIEAAGRTYVFSNKVNIASQGSSIPVGYGFSLVSSQVLSASIKSYSTNSVSQNEFKSLQNSSAFLDFLSD